MKQLNSSSEVTQLIQEINNDVLELLQLTKQFESGAMGKTTDELYNEIRPSVHLINRTLSPMLAYVDVNSSLREKMQIKFNYPVGYDCFKVLKSNERTIVFREDPYLKNNYQKVGGQMTMQKSGTLISLFGDYGVMFENPDYDFDAYYNGQLRVVKYALFNFMNNTELKSFLIGMKGVLTNS